MGERSDFRPNDTDVLKDRWRSYITDNRLNTTAQREAIVEQFLRTRDHVSIDELLTKVRKRHPKVGYATVYRTLPLLVECGVLKEMDLESILARRALKRERFLGGTDAGAVMGVHPYMTPRLQDKIAARLGAFTVLRHRHELYGTCPKYSGDTDGICPNEQQRKK